MVLCCNNLAYQWLCRAPGADNFEYLTSSDATANTLRVEMTTASNGAEYHCFITDANSDMGSTCVATIKLDILDWEMEYNTSLRYRGYVYDQETGFYYVSSSYYDPAIGRFVSPDDVTLF